MESIAQGTCLVSRPAKAYLTPTSVYLTKLEYFVLFLFLSSFFSLSFLPFFFFFLRIVFAEIVTLFERTFGFLVSFLNLENSPICQ